MSPRPLLLLDVDGVLRPIGGANATEEIVIDGPELETIRYDPRLPGWLDLLSERFELVWATLWEGEANEHLAPALGLTPLKWIRFSEGIGMPPGPNEKLAAVKRFVEERPFAWVDDVVGHEELRWCETRSVPSLVLEIEPSSGLQAHHVEALLAFAAAIPRD